MADDALTFSRGRRAPSRGGGGLVVALLVTVALLAATRVWWTPSAPDHLVEVTGDVPRPGLHLVDSPTAAAALEAAGADVDQLHDVPAGVLAPGERLQVAQQRVARLPPSDPLLVALPIDLNLADAEALAAVPGLGRTTAEAIVAERERAGPFRSLYDVARVRGVGDRGVQLLEPFAVVSDPGPMSLNEASAAQLEQLPGIGPVLAARIVVDRADRGPFASVEDLGRVPGVGAATVERLRELVTVER
ncbi:MAG: helix-hairpin-helix domain-containing protein [Myxococcales bacterium]|nr:helix-hairpin-helix domain-containing protein [Myxococcales bacterium]